MNNKDYLKLAAAVVFCELVGIGGAFFTAPAVSSTWYYFLEKPFFQPPGWLFSPVWLALYALMGVSAFLIWKNGLEKKEVKTALGVFGAQLFLNFIWSVVFFGAKSPGWAFAEIILLLFFIIATIILFAKISKLAAWLLVPYVLWVGFASFLNYSIWQLNSNQEERGTGFGNSQIEKVITDYLLTQSQFSWKTTAGSQNFCGIENFTPEGGLFPIYVWVYCAEYTLENGNLKTQSGTSMPVKINYPNELSFYDLNKFSYEAPRDGSYNGPDIERIFPEDVRQKISSFDKKIIIRKVEEVALNNILSWELIKQAINDCRAERAFQTHSRNVTLRLKNGEELAAVEPSIDDIIDIAVAAKNNCGPIIIGTE